MLLFMGARTKRRKSKVVDSFFIETPKIDAADLIGDAFAQAMGTVENNSEMLKLRRRIETGSMKNKCCRSKPRCKKCPTVMHRLRKQGALQLDDAALRAALVKARKW